eukprot:scaffold163136_cov32-Tisochrysis_lutea.AAC.3
MLFRPPAVTRPYLAACDSPRLRTQGIACIPLGCPTTPLSTRCVAALHLLQKPVAAVAPARHARSPDQNWRPTSLLQATSVT